MSKFIRLVSTFKNGLLSPRLRGTIQKPDDFSSAEVLDNFVIDKTGAATKRPGLLKITSDTYAANLQHFSFNVLGKEYTFRFNPNVQFTAVDGSLNSTYITVSENGGAFSSIVKCFGTGNATSTTNITDLYLWSGRYFNCPFPTVGPANYFYESGLRTYMSKYLTVHQAEKISDRTIVFTTDNFSFLVSMLDSYTGAGATSYLKRQFYIYPYFVSNVLLLQNLDKNITDTVKCPIVPSNFPFNPLNTNTSITVNINTLGLNIGGDSYTQTGTDGTSGVVSQTGNKFIYYLTVPRSMVYINNTKVDLVGKFISLPSTDSTQDVVYFITTEYASGSTTIDYLVIKVIGGTPLSNTSQWKLSTFGGDSHPRSVAYCFGRLMYGNTATSPTQWWASATHPDNPYYYQGFMESSLKQDKDNDVSLINYAGKSGGGSTDIYRFGFSNFVPSHGEINWISSRRRIHFGTSLGETQLTINNGTYTAASFEQNITGSNNSTLCDVAVGDRKIFYLSNKGRDIRQISTEDKDYESIDNLVSIALEGLNIKFKKIVWFEDQNILAAFTIDKRLFLISIHSDVEVRAIAEVKTSKDILDISANPYHLYVFLKDSSNIVFTEMMFINRPYESTGSLYEIPILHGDLYQVATDGTSFAALFANYYGKTVKIFFNNSVTDFEVPASAFSSSLIPIDLASVSESYPAYIYEDSEYCKIKSLPIHEGANFGSSVGDIQRVDRLSLLIDKSGPFKYGSEESSLLESEGVTSNTTKIVTMDFPQSPDREQVFIIESDHPTPLNISGVSLRGVSYSGE